MAPLRAERETVGGRESNPSVTVQSQSMSEIISPCVSFAAVVLVMLRRLIGLFAWISAEVKDHDYVIQTSKMEAYPAVRVVTPSTG